MRLLTSSGTKMIADLHRAFEYYVICHYFVKVLTGKILLKYHSTLRR